ncbi:MAG: tRNA (cytidine(34)-2'-O)-methyltransferase [Alphaproteobacteria bacterium ADurb.Bin438]|nr:MAG: tRNA (cytidine(34)-2'-O)-methyltransferase [Alphaproteobacteria bacterium ADurb.Bin438]
MKIVLFEPDIPQNTGTIIRMAACFGIPLEIIEPCGFVFDDKALKRAGMDYIDLKKIKFHLSFEDFLNSKSEDERIVLLTTKSSENLYDFKFKENDILLFGKESAGVTDEIHEKSDARIRIPMKEGYRSLNLAISTAIAVSEGIRQTGI